MFFQSMATYIRTGAFYSESVERAAAGGGVELRQMMRAVSMKLNQGMALHVALAPYKSRLPEMVLPVLEVGEVSGTLDDACARLAAAFLMDDKFEQKFRLYAPNPAVLIAIILGTQAIFGFTRDWTELGIELLTTLVKILIVAFVGRLLLFQIYRWRPFRVQFDRVKMAIPFVGHVSRKVATARWTRAFATMWHAGVPISQALDVASRAALNAYYERGILRARDATRQGKSLVESLRTIEMLPRYTLDVLETGEKTGRFAEALDSFVERLEDEALTMAAQETMTALALGYLIFMLATIFLALSGVLH